MSPAGQSISHEGSRRPSSSAAVSWRAVHQADLVGPARCTVLTVIDLHSHVLPGLDDGARDLEESVAMARAAAADGTTVLAATPHVRDDYPTPADAMERALAELRSRLDLEGIALRVVSGGELALDYLAKLGKDELQRFGLAGNPDYLLLEFPYHGWPLDLADRVFRLRAGGITPVLAHPERNQDVQAHPERLDPLVRSGALVQLTAASIDGRLGRASQSCAVRLLEIELAHLIASDAHSPEVRSIGLRGARNSLGDEELGEWLTIAVPSAILDGGLPPPRPTRKPRQRRWRRRRSV